MMGKLTTEEDEPPMIHRGSRTVTGAESNFGAGLFKPPSKSKIEMPLNEIAGKPNPKSVIHEGIDKNRPVGKKIFFQTRKRLRV